MPSERVDLHACATSTAPVTHPAWAAPSSTLQKNLESELFGNLETTTPHAPREPEGEEVTDVITDKVDSSVLL